MTAAPHCHELSRQSPSWRTAPRMRACACDGAPACMGINWNCRVSARQCAAVRPPCGLPPVGHHVGRGSERADGSDDRPAPARAAHGPTSPNGCGGDGMWVTGVGRHGVGTSRGGTGPLRPREQPRLATEFVCASERGAGGVAEAFARRGKAATWVNVGEPVANGRDRERATRRQSDPHPTANRRARPRVRRGMNGIAIAARSEA